MNALNYVLPQIILCAVMQFSLPSGFTNAQTQPETSQGKASTDNQIQDQARPHVQASSAVEAGRYLAIVAGCNDCHTQGYLQTEGKIPEQDWLTGSNLGWRGPWGTTYPANLCLRVQQISEDVWVSMLHTRYANPPMPWINVNRMSEQDARALYQYLKSLGAKGEAVPQYVPPGEEPTTPYISFEPQNTGAAAQ